MKPPIKSAQNQYLKLYRSLEKRRSREEKRLLPLEGVRLVEEAVKRKAVLEYILLRAGAGSDEFAFLQQVAANTPVLLVDEELFDKTAFTESPQGILAVVRRPQWELADVFSRGPALLLVADRVQDPGNLGTMVRSAAAAGAGGVILLPGTVDAANPKALRAAMGAFFALPVVEAGFDELQQALTEHHCRLVATAMRPGSIRYDHFNWAGAVAVAIGNEGAGVSPDVARAADASVTIGMHAAVESLNAAVAMSVIFFEAARQRDQIQ